MQGVASLVGIVTPRADRGHPLLLAVNDILPGLVFGGRVSDVRTRNSPFDDGDEPREVD